MFNFPLLDFRRTPFTIIVAGTAVALFLIGALDGEAGKGYFEKLVIWGEIWTGEVWRPFTTTLLHANVLHVFFNIYWLLVFGSALESWHGSLRISGFVLLVAYVSSLAEFCFVPLFGGGLVTSVGLSGVVYGLFGLLWAGARFRRDYAAICPPQVVQVMIGWFLLCFVLTYTKVMPVANVAHGVGLGAGWLVGMAAFDVRRRALWWAAVGFGSLVILTTLVICPWHPLFRFVRDNGLWWVQRVL